jgi:SHS2 domain-containing protein
MEKYEFLEHTADIKFQAFGKTIEEAFKNSILATVNSICDEKIKKNIVKKISVKRKDSESLLYGLLDEIVYLFDANSFLVSDVKKIKIKGNELEAELIGDSSKGYEIKEHIKSVTYSEMFVRKEKDKWICQVVLDI